MMKNMEGYNLNEELSSELWRATSSEDGSHVLIKFSKDDCVSLSALALCRHELEMGSKVRDIAGVLAAQQVLMGNGLVGLLFEDCGYKLLSEYIPHFRAKLAFDLQATILEFLHISINSRLINVISRRRILINFFLPPTT